MATFKRIVALWLSRTTSFDHFGRCYRCGLSLRFSNTWRRRGLPFHSTPYSRTGACFPLCEYCWRKLGTPEERWPYYLRLMDKWAESGDPEFLFTRELVRQAVLEGK